MKANEVAEYLYLLDIDLYSRQVVQTKLQRFHFHVFVK